ncbi:MAG: porin [Acidobacteria bacterium]|nr:porin [Acidobacteriota bacterium]
MLVTRTTRHGWSALALALATFITAPAWAQTPGAPTPTSSTPKFFQNIQLGGLADVYYDYNSNKVEGDAPFRNFDTRHNKARFSMAQLWAAKAPTADSRIGFNVKLNAGHASDLIHGAEPSTLAAFDRTGAVALQQVYVSYLAPIGSGLQIDAGKYVTQHGAEVIEAKDNWNYSRSLLFALAIPYYHTGVRASYTVNDKVSFMGTVVNGWNNLEDNNGAKTFGGQVIVKPVPQLSIVQNYMGGAEQTDNNDDVRHLFDTTVTITATDRISLIGNYDYGKDSLAGSGVSWQGVAGYVKVQATPWLAVIPRVEWFDDPDGFMTGTSQALKDATITGELKFMDNLLWRVEYRRDWSDIAAFTKKSGAAVDSQNTFGMGFLYSYSFTTR